MRDPIFEELKHWMFNDALPFWSVEGVDRRNGGYVEHFTMAGEPYTETKRVFVICRQIYVFAHASLLGWSEGAMLADHGYRFLNKAWMGDGLGWARRLDEEGRPIDTTPDLYVMAFALFALAWQYRMSSDPQALMRAHKTLDVIQTRLGHASRAGFLHEHPATGPRRQNPHMHLVEGLLGLAECSGDSRFLEAAEQIVRLFVGRLFDQRSQTLAEYFAEDWGPLDTPEGRVTEPGHQFEWAWILANYQRLSGSDVSQTIVALHASAERHGVDPDTHITYNVVRNDGTALNRGSRVWPNTERMKASVAMYELTGRSPDGDLAQIGRLLLDRYLAVAPPGRWFDSLDEQGKLKSDKIPTSTLYHLFLAFSEALRVAPAIGALVPDSTSAVSDQIETFAMQSR